MHKYSLLKFTIFLLLFGMLISACKKEESISEHRLELQVFDDSEQDSLSLKYNKLRVYALLIPESVDGTIKQKVSSQADPEGFETELSLSSYEEKEGKTTYLAKELLVGISAAENTDASARRIKVNYPSDIISVELGDNLVSGSFPFTGRKQLYYRLEGSSDLEVYSFGAVGNEREAVHIATDRVPNARLIPLEFRSGNGFDYFSQTFMFHDGDFSVYNGEEYYVGIDIADGYYAGKVYLHYYDKIFSVDFGNEGIFYLE